MTPIKFIEKAIEGGWKSEAYENNLWGDSFPIEVILLDPKAWEAYWKTQGDGNESTCKKAAHQCMREMVDELNSGGTIESYLETL